MKIILGVLASLLTFSVNAQNISENYKLIENISYIDKTSDSYQTERCKLDVYYPTHENNFPTVIWFHGGGLEVGEKHIPEELKNQGVAVVAVNYRLSPKVTNPAYTEDAAASVAWVFKNIASYGGDTKRIYVSGHSAGGYLALMVGLDKSYLNKYGIDANDIKALIPISGQTNTHYTIRKERRLDMNLPVVDAFAPLNKARKDIPPTLLITGGRELEIAARYEENIHLEAILKSLGNKDVMLYEVEGFDHGTVLGPACLLLLRWINRYK